MSFKKVETSKLEGSSTEQTTNSYKFKVEMIVSLFAENELQAAELLDSNGGFVISRDVELLETTKIHEAKADEKE